MTRQEQSGERSLVFSQWLKDHLPDSWDGFRVYNQDWILWDKNNKRLMLLEEKMFMKNIAADFRTLIRTVLHPALLKYCKEIGMEYRGYHLIQFQNTGPEDGNIFLDRKKVSKEFLIKFLSMR